MRAQIVKMGIDAALAGMKKILPGVVLSYDAETSTCSVKPAVHRLVPTAEDPDEDYVEEEPVLQNVPVLWPRGRNFRVLGTLEAGDSVLLLVSDRDISGWRRSGKASEPDNAQKHAWSSAVALPGLEADGHEMDTPTDAAALASALDAFGQAVAELPDPTSPSTALTAIIGILDAARAVWGGPLATPPAPLASVASATLKLED